MSTFRFKQFSIQQQHSAMKVGTDGVLLGAWTNPPELGNVLDVGCGTGLLALMMAQKSANCTIYAIEIDEYASKEAKVNFHNSPFKNLNPPSCLDFRDFETPLQFDLIISNPPFFENGVPSLDESRNKARFTQSLSPDEFLQKAVTILSPNGRISVIYPTEIGQSFIGKAKLLNLYCRRICSVKPNPDKPASRLLIEMALGKPEFEPMPESFAIEISRHVYTEEYKQLCKDFYLAF